MNQAKSFFLILFLCSFMHCPFAFTQSEEIPATSSDPSVIIANKSGGSISKSEIFNSGKLEVSKISEESMKISSFRMTLVCGKEVSEFQKDKNGELTDEMRNGLYFCKAGSKMYIEYLELIIDNNLIRKLPPLSFVLSE